MLMRNSPVLCFQFSTDLVAFYSRFCQKLDNNKVTNSPQEKLITRKIKIKKMLMIKMGNGLLFSFLRLNPDHFSSIELSRAL